MHGFPLTPAAAGVLLASYGLGCASTGYYLVRAVKGKDIHDVGSGFVGAKNVARTVGRWGFVVTLLGDAAKGALAVWMMRCLTSDEALAVLAWLAVALGNLWPVQLGFRGGKGMATSLGALFIFDGELLLIYMVMAAAASLMLRNSVLGGLLAVALVPAVAFMRGGSMVAGLGIAVVAVLILFAHRANLVEEFTGLRGGGPPPA